VSEGLRQLEETDYLLLIANDKTTHAGKLFDYMATGKPILALTPVDGAIAQILHETQTGWCIEPQDKNAIQRFLTEALDRRTHSADQLKPRWSAIQKYSWPNLVASLVSNTSVSDNTYAHLSSR
jgi:glycosyltransferase involved in cell wall biosynthesis